MSEYIYFVLTAFWFGLFFSFLGSHGAFVIARERFFWRVLQEDAINRSLEATADEVIRIKRW